MHRISCRLRRSPSQVHSHCMRECLIRYLYTDIHTYIHIYTPMYNRGKECRSRCCHHLRYLGYTNKIGRHRWAGLAPMESQRKEVLIHQRTGNWLQNCNSNCMKRQSKCCRQPLPPNSTIASTSACVHGSANFLPAAMQLVFAADHEMLDQVVCTE